MSRFLYALVAALALAACHTDEIVSPRDCTAITQRGLHADTTTIHCEP